MPQKTHNEGSRFPRLFGAPAATACRVRLVRPSEPGVPARGRTRCHQPMAPWSLLALPFWPLRSLPPTFSVFRRVQAMIASAGLVLGLAGALECEQAAAKRATFGVTSVKLAKGCELASPLSTRVVSAFPACRSGR
jgi:hypothetical protein